MAKQPRIITEVDRNEAKRMVTAWLKEEIYFREQGNGPMEAQCRCMAKAMAETYGIECMIYEEHRNG